MTIFNTDSIRQRPTTDGMTPEQLKEFYKTAREARRGTCGGLLEQMNAGHVHSYFTQPKPLSDYLTYYPDKKQKEYPMADIPSSNKRELINKYYAAIDKLEAQIKKLQDDKTLSVAERQKKIARRLDIIKDYRFSIENAKQYLAAREKKDQELYNKFFKTK
ncbi:MAG: hypothetical protein IJ866_00905 [Alphaproteobacteria bacterium]|nr:hypothetical protein [Alphaproteobacteria bacterium]